MSRIEYSTKTSFVQGARSSQADWFRAITVEAYGGALFLMGDGHGAWNQKKTDEVTAFFEEQIDMLPIHFSVDPPCPSEALDWIYRGAASRFVDENIGFAGGSSIICCFVTTEQYAVLVRGDSEVILEHEDRARVITPFDWNTEYGNVLATAIEKATKKQFKGMVKRTDALPWEERYRPSFQVSAFTPASVECLPETIGLIGGRGISFNGVSTETVKQVMEICAGISEIEDPSTRATRVGVALANDCSTRGLTITMASDGIRSKGCFPLCGTIGAYTARLQTPDLTPCMLIYGSHDSILMRNTGEPRVGTNPLKLNVLRGMLGEPTDPRRLLSSTTHFLQMMSRPDALQILKAAYDMWLPLAADAAWRKAIEEQFEYFETTPTLADAENPLEFLNRAAVLNLSDDNVSSARIEIH